MTGYLPCYPSGIMVDIDIPFKFFDDIDTTYYNDYNNTKVFLNKINLMTNYKIICKPVIKIIDDEVIVGLLTEGNQYVPIKDPEMNNEDELLELKENKYVWWILQHSLVFLAMIHFQSQSNILPFCGIATGEATWVKGATWLEGTVTNCWEFENWFGATYMNCWGWIWPGE